MHDCPCCGEAVYSDDPSDLCSCCIEAGCELSDCECTNPDCEGDCAYFDCQIPMCGECCTPMTFCTDGQWHSNCDGDHA